MVEPDFLPGELGGRSPDVRIAETFAPVAVNRVAHHSDVGAGLDDERVCEIRVLPLRFEEDPHEPKRLVDLVLEAGESDPLLRGNRDELPTRQFRLERLHVFRRNEIDLVHGDERLHVNSVPRQDVDQLVLGDILAYDDRAVQISPLPADVGDEVLVEFLQLDRCVHAETTAVRLRQGDIGGTLVQPDPRRPEFLLEDIDMSLEHVDHQEDQVAASGYGEDLLPPSAALRRTADESGHVEYLDLRAPMLEETRDHVQGGEVVRGYCAVRVRDLIEQRRLADGREADETGGRIAALLDGITRSSAAPFESPRLLLVLEPSQLRLQPADVMLCRLVVRRLLDLVLGRFDLLFDRHSMTNRAGLTSKNFSTQVRDGVTTRSGCPRAPDPSPRTAPSVGTSRCTAKGRDLQAPDGGTVPRSRASPSVLPRCRPARTR